MSGEFNKVLTLLTMIGLGAFAVLNAGKVTTLSDGLAGTAIKYTSGIAGLGGSQAQ